mmetsp:Transcript_26650/g.38194  ORF Transcript_26650/g.38194 Transcript_26650/m.38194 type:complete len:346 (-) Transcript_26650:218-1255(-)
MLRKKAQPENSPVETEELIKVGNDLENPSVGAPKVNRAEPGCCRLFCEGFFVCLVTFCLATAAHVGYNTYYPSLSESAATANVPTAQKTAAVEIPFETAPKCTEAQLAGITKQINPAHTGCSEEVFKQECPITQETKASNPTWLVSYYSKRSDTSNFVAIASDCKNMFSVVAGSSPPPTGKVYCIVKDPAKAEEATKAMSGVAGLSVHNQALTRTGATTLDAFVGANIDGTINVLDLENGEEFEALAGGRKQALTRTEYLTYMFDWKGSWSGYGRNTKVITSMLDKLGFTCYWAGMGKLWRITSCMYREYGEAHKYWSHVACANRNLAPLLVEEMESLFDKTISG